MVKRLFMPGFPFRYFSRQFLVFLFCGGIAAVANFSSRFFFNGFTGFGNAVLLAHLTGMVTFFFLTRSFVFEKSGRSAQREFFLFSLVNVGTVIQTYLVSVGLAHYLFPALAFDFHAETIAHAAGISIPAFTSYFAHKHLSFKGK